MDVEETSLGGEWSYKPDRFHVGGLLGYAREGYDDSRWEKMDVPSNWYREGLDRSGTVWFRKGFDLEPEEGWRYQLEFKSVDYKADVTLNGERLGEHEGYFDRFSFDVTDALKEHNELAVRVDSPRESFFSYITGKKYIKGVLDQWDCRPGGLDPFRGRDANTGGIWRDVVVRRTGDYVLGDVKLTPELREGGADMSVALPILAYRDGEAVVRVKVAPKNFEGASYEVERRVALSKGENAAKLDLAMDGAKLWWTWDLGDPNLYTYTVEVKDGDRVSDEARGNVGVRRFEQREDGWYLNGKRFFVRGTNYISTQWMSEGPSKYDADFELMRRAHMNGVRVHAHVEDDSFYDRCDEEGILVWQDFILQWSYQDKLKDKAVGMIRKLVRHLYNHPSVMVYACHNEPISLDNLGDVLKQALEAIGIRLGGDASPEELARAKGAMLDILDGRRFLAQAGVTEFDKALEAAAKEEDPSRLVKLSSPTTEHKYFGWYTGDFTQYRADAERAGMIISEFGAQGLPNVETMREILTEGQLEPTAWNYLAHWMPTDFQPLQTHTIARIDRGGSIEEFVRNSQEYQAKVNKFAIENYRRHKHEPVTALFQFMLVDCWDDAITWSLADFKRRPKLAFDAVATAYQPILVSVEWERESFKQGEEASLPVYITNDLYEGHEDAALRISLVDGEGNVVKEERAPVEVWESSSRRVGEFRWPTASCEPGEYTLRLELEGGGQTLSRNEYEFTVEPV